MKVTAKAMTQIPLDPQALELDRCYRAEGDEVRLVTTLDENNVTYRARGPRHFLDWHETASQKTMKRQAFAEEAREEVPYFWEPSRGRGLA